LRGTPDFHAHRRVLIAGRGFAALEALIALRTLAGHQVAWGELRAEPGQVMLLTGGEPRYFEGIAGGGEGGTASSGPLWWPSAKVAGRYLAPFLGGQGRGAAALKEGVDVNVEIANGRVQRG